MTLCVTEWLITSFINLMNFNLIYFITFIHYGHFYSATSSPLLRGAPDYSTDTVSEFHAEAHIVHCNECLVYVSMYVYMYVHTWFLCKK